MTQLRPMYKLFLSLPDTVSLYSLAPASASAIQQPEDEPGSSVQGAARSLKKYACPICTALKGHPGDLDAAIGRTKRTRSVSFIATHMSVMPSSHCQDAHMLKHDACLFPGDPHHRAELWCTESCMEVLGLEVQT